MSDYEGIVPEAVFEELPAKEEEKMKMTEKNPENRKAEKRAFPLKNLLRALELQRAEDVRQIMEQPKTS